MTNVTANDYWNAQADSFDEAADHGLRDPAVRLAWKELLLRLLPAPPARVADLGCGTGSLSVLLAQCGYTVTGVDFAASMVAAAERKASGLGLPVSFHVGDATDPPLPAGEFDVVLCRHVLWSLPQPEDVVGRWVRLLDDVGRLVLIEGRWWTGGGMTSREVRTAVLTHRAEAASESLTDPAFWGGPIEDERFVVVSRS